MTPRAPAPHGHDNAGASAPALPDVSSLRWWGQAVLRGGTLRADECFTGERSRQRVMSELCVLGEKGWLRFKSQLLLCEPR